jgi:uncharacterized protein
MQYQDINTIATKIDASLSAAEIQAMAAGMLCVNDRARAEFWLQEIMQINGTVNFEDNALLESLFEETRSQLSNDEFTFELLLPDDSSPLDEQVDALRRWSQGFLYGLGTGTTGAKWPEDVREIVKDIAECTKLETDANDEEAEADFMEITEYLRAAVIFLRTELCSGGTGTIH